MAGSSAATVARSVVVTCEPVIALTRSVKVVLIVDVETLEPLNKAVKSAWAWVVEALPATAVASSERTVFRLLNVNWKPAWEISWPSLVSFSRSEMVTPDLAARLCNSD